MAFAHLDRRRLIGAGFITATAAGVSTSAVAQARPASGFDLALQAGVRPGSPDDQSAALQKAIDQAAAARVPLALPPGDYRAADLKLPSGAQLVGIRGASRLVLARANRSLLSASLADNVTLTGLTLDGGRQPLPARRGLVHGETARGLRIADCTIRNAGGTAVMLIGCDGDIAGNEILDSHDVALMSNDAQGLTIARNVIRNAGDNGILVWRGKAGDDGTLVIDNRIEGISNRSGGSGQYGNAVNVFRAANVIVRGNRIRNCAFTAVRGNAADNMQASGNTITGMGEVAIYAEFGFSGALMSGNVIDDAALGIVATNFNEGGRLAVISGNIIRNLRPRRPAGTDPTDGAGIGIAVEADAAVSGNVVENAPSVGIHLGFGRYLRDISATGNVVRNARIGISVSVAAGAGAAVIADNLISGAKAGALVGFDHSRAVTGDLLKDGVAAYPHLTVNGNRSQ